MEYHRRLISLIVDGSITSREELERGKVRLCREYGMGGVPPNSEVLRHATPEEVPLVLPLLRKKPVRTMSGVAVVAVMTSPHECPHGRCIYCPGGVERNSPQSYTGQEPAARRGARHGFDPFDQTADRLSQLERIGHPTDKVELIIMGGTFTSRPRDYQEGFVRRCFDAMNGCVSGDMEEAHAINESAGHRCVGMTLETRPDWLSEEQAAFSMRLGATRVELGVQVLDDHILGAVGRGHGVAEIIEATTVAKRAGLKVCYHLMPGLPGSSPDKDIESFRRMVDDRRFRPDMIKIYPTLVIEGTPLHEMWKRGDYSPYTTEEAVEVIAKMKRLVPGYMRIQRIQRDIPVSLIERGVDKGHLRQLVRERMALLGWRCNCIRCREVGLRDLAPSEGEESLNRRSYPASGGMEHFLSFDLDSGALIGFLRLRVDGDTATVRELKVFGPLTPIGGRAEDWQHRGYGRRLLAEAERLASEEGCRVMRVTSGVGVRSYYRSLGFVRQGAYMIKSLDPNH